MAHVTVTINDKRYQISCDDGQEAHLSRLGAYVDKRIDELIAAVGQVGDDRLLVMASLLVTDELSDAYAEMEAIRNDAGIAARLDAEEELADGIESLAGRIENIALRLEQS